MAALYQATEASVDKVVNASLKFYLAWVRTQVLLEPQRRDVYLLVDGNVSHIHS
jgi:hypothetical protein